MVTSEIGESFQQGTKYERGRLPGARLDLANKPATYKSYPSTPKLPLTPPQIDRGAPLWSLLMERRSVRRLSDAPLTEMDLSQLLWAAQGITYATSDFAFRTAPSAGALYPVETYVVVHSVEGIESGVYHYAVKRHELDQLKVGDFREAVGRAALDQKIAYSANVVFVWTAVFERSKWKYKQRAYRYVYLDAGHIAQNVALGAVALGLGSCQIAAIYDDEANALLDVDGVEESTIYMTVVERGK